MSRTRRFFIRAAIAGSVLALTVPGFAQPATSWPVKPIRFIVGFPAGGAADTVARHLANKLGPALGQPVVVDNKPGAGSTVSAAVAAQAPPDGYTLLLGSASGISTPQHVFKKLAYDPRRDFVPVALFGRLPLLLVVNPAIPAKDLRGVVEHLKASAEPVHYGSFGVGSTSHLAMELLKRSAGAQMTHVPYKGSPQMHGEMLGAQGVSMAIDSIHSTLPLIEAGKLRAIASTGAQRTLLLPQLPTFTEQGHPDISFSGWFGVFAPVGTPDAVVKRLSAEMARAVKLPDLREQLAQIGVEAIHVDGPAAAAFLEMDHALWGEAARIADVQLD